MFDNIDTYKTINTTSEESLFKDRGSKFIGQAHPVSSENEIEPILLQLKTNHNKASHVCYAWQLGKNYEQYRANDDGEPNNSAGIPIYGQIQSFDVTEILVTVIRYYGGTNLGVGGLIQAYKTAAQLALESAKIKIKVITQSLNIQFEYPLLHTVMRIIKEEQLDIVNQEMHLSCSITVSVRKNAIEQVKERFDLVFGLKTTLEDF
ncbi:IMPACT family protein [Leeuwenhoekiella aequorea]|uniref:Putative YigZ family protein n=1 Tax=Leeuwenhoekiella aequorea TaxID=283736 RepID=A0A4Q0PBC8_9FLAO|nr:YigZ family protein [Leeuwenhoekiella aequorea]RXG23219.1 putative YigZ family protein [Leeuwenhoekiella aequorea]